MDKKLKNFKILKRLRNYMSFLNALLNLKSLGNRKQKPLKNLTTKDQVMSPERNKIKSGIDSTQKASA
jgi:hypothetical protein